MRSKTVLFIILSGVLLASLRGFAADIPFLGEPPSRPLEFLNTHTGERLEINYRGNTRYNAREMAKLDNFLRDYRTGRSREMDGDLLGLINGLKLILEERHPGAKIEFEIISGYRSRETNEMLRAAGGAQAKESYHIEGQAVDIRVSGISLTELRDTAWCMGRGGVGYYRGENFIHVDTGRVRYWNWAPDPWMCRKNDGLNH